MEANIAEKLQRLERFQDLSLEQQLGQLILRNPLHTAGEKDEITGLLKKGCLGGFYVPAYIDPDLIRTWQEISPIPLFIATDIESNFHSQAYPVTPLPKAITLGALGDEESAYQWGTVAAREAKDAGINYAFGPVVDVSFCTENDVGCCRNFSADSEAVGRLGCAVVKAYQDNGLQVAAKHFPGLGGDIPDSHMRMPVLDVTKETLLENELLPYRMAIEKVGLNGIMTGHVMMPQIDPDLPATISPATGRLLAELKFEGLLITDSLGMKGLKLLFPPRQSHLMALLAGHDILLSDYQTPAGEILEGLVQDVRENRLPLEIVHKSLRKIARQKRWVNEHAAITPDAEKNRHVSMRISRDALTGVGDIPKNPQPEVLIFAQDVIHQGKGVETEMSASIRHSAAFLRKCEELLPDCEILPLSACPTQQEIEKALTTSVSRTNVIFIGEAYAACYKGTAFFADGVYGLLDALKHKLT
ncbi:MAG: hypothetical protein KAU28_04370, partial [Phycisphaerae bacterium]|nr:hypothetical protein [Phycisphaerae bacterium]